MTTSARTRRVSSPAYYLARPAALWLAAFTPRPQAASEPRPEPVPGPADRASYAAEVRGPAADLI
jgi:hypothetical protein